MWVRILLAAICGASFLPTDAWAQHLELSSEKMRAHVKYLSSDELEGRGVGTRGGKLATNYLAAQLQAEGVASAGENGTYFQSVPLVGVQTKNTAKLSLSSKAGTTAFSYVTDFVGGPLCKGP